MALASSPAGTVVTHPPPGPYEEIESALESTERGRRFLAEHACRARAAETGTLLEAVARLERRVAARFPSTDVESHRTDVADLADVIRQAEADLRALGPAHDRTRRSLDGLPEPDEVPLPAPDPVETTERIQEIAWTMRESGFDATLCDRLDAHATEMYRASAAYGVTSRRAEILSDMLSILRLRIEVMTESWPGSRAEQKDMPLPTTVAIAGDDLEFVLVDDPRASDAARAAAPVPDGTARALLAHLESLSTRERLRLFT